MNSRSKHQVSDNHTSYHRKSTLGKQASYETSAEVHWSNRMWQNHDNLAVEEKQIAVVYPDKGCNRLCTNTREAMCFMVLKTPLQTFILRYGLTYFLEMLEEGGSAFPHMISLCVLMADTCLQN